MPKKRNQSEFLRRWNANNAYREARQSALAIQSANECWMPRGNFYTEHDIGNKSIRYPDGSLRSVKTRKVSDTGGTSFCVFDDNTPLL